MSTTVPALLAARAADEPEHVALRLPEGPELTVGDWQARSTAVARALVAQGVRPGDRVAIRLPWLEYAVAYVAVQAAGAVAVPLSGGPDPALHGAVRVLTSLTDLTGGDDVGLPEVRPDALAQIISTSGTTGVPKGVAATHANLTYGFEPRPRRRRFAHSRTFLHAFPIGTNGAQNMLLYALAAAPTAIPLAEFDSDRFAALAEEHRAGTVFLVPTMAVDLLSAGVAGRYDLTGVVLVSSSAAALPPAVAAALPRVFPRATLVNFYSSTESGPAETTMILDQDRPGSVGRPPAGDLRIADPDEDGVGEVWLRSPVAPRSYAGDPGATAATFRDGWVRMGDVGYLDADGYLYLVDRESDLVKSGGFRVSTLRIEAALYEHPAIAEACVTGIPHRTLGTAVAAAVVPRRPVGAEELRAYLEQRLARHEVPLRFLTVASLPRNETGKVVKREVRRLFTAAPRRAGRPARTPAEATLCRLWAELLRVPAVGADDDFFALGGDSLTATQLATLVSKEFDVDASVALVFDIPVLGAQAAALEALAGRSGGTAPTGSGGLGSTQEYFLDWMHVTADRQIQPVTVSLRLREPLDLPALERSLADLLERHDMLRAVFTRTGMRIPPAGRVDLTVRDVSGEAEAYALACAEVERAFDIHAGPLLRVTVLRLGPAEQILLLIAEHLVFDGMSYAVLLRELGLLYSAYRLGRPAPALPVPPLTAAEFFARTRSEWAANAGFWRHRLAGAPQALPTLPGHDPAAPRYVGRCVEFAVPASVGRALRQYARERRVTTFMAALAAWCAVLRDWTGAEELVVQTPVTGRTHQEDESLVGCLVQLLMIRVPLTAGSFDALVSAVRARVVEAVDHQVHRFLDVAAMVPYPVHFFFESWGGPAHLPGVESEPYPLPPELRLHWPFAPGDPDLSAPRLSLVQQPDGELSGRLLYNELAYERATVVSLGDRLVAVLSNLATGRTP